MPSVLDTKVPDEGDPVTVGIGDCAQLDALVHRLDCPWGQAPSADIGDLPVQVVHGEVQQARSGAVGVEGDLDPAIFGYPPFDEATRHRQVVGGTAEEAFVPGCL